MGTARRASVCAKPIPLDLHGSCPPSSASPSNRSLWISCCSNGAPLGFKCLRMADKQLYFSQRWMCAQKRKTFFTAGDEEAPSQLWFMGCTSHVQPTHTSELQMFSVHGKRESKNIYFQCSFLGKKELLLSMQMSRTALFKGHVTQQNVIFG